MLLNKRQKIVQEAFLNNEEAVIKRLKSVYNQSLKDIEAKAKKLQKQIEQLDEVYKMTEDEAEREKILSQKRSKVYQKQYQESLKKQVSDIMDTMYEKEFKTVSEYLDKCYEEGFLGTMYDLQGQNIPLCFPMDQEAMVRAVQLDSKISEGLYTRLGEDVSLLKRKITAQVSRGISTGMSFQQVAQQLAAYTNIGYNNAVRIARTEGHRIQVQSGMDACYKAKEKGADVVKQWDSTLDGRTRPEHRKCDGEIKELDEEFSNGLMFPGDPSGRAKEVINCRCALLQRARWALDDDELEELKKRADYFGLDKTDSFEDFKKKYLKALDDPYANMTFLQKKELINNNEQKMKQLQQERKQAEFEAIMASTPEEMETAFAKSKSIKKQIDDIALENENITKALGLPTNAKERFLVQDIDFNILPHDVNDNEYDAVSSWCRTGYVDINRYMRQGDKGVRPQSIKDARILQECLERNVVKEPFTTKRGINTSAMDKWFGGEGWKNEGFNPNGAVIVDKGFCATSPAVRGGFGGDVVAYIDVPAGAKGAYIGDISAATEEKEFLLQCGTRFELKEVVVTYDKWNEPHYEVYMKVIVDE